MKRRTTLWNNFEKKQIQASKGTYHEHLEIFEALYREAVYFGVFPPENPLEGIEVDIHLAAVLNVRKDHRKNRPRPSTT